MNAVNRVVVTGLGAITRIASQPRTVPKLTQASVPPVTAQSTMPERTM